MTYTNQLLQDILDAMPDTAGLNRETTQQAIQAILNGLATETKVEAVRSLLQSIYDDCCPTQHLQDILDAMPTGGDYALETSMQTSLTRLQSILDRITSVEADLGYDALLDPLDTQKKSLDDVQDKLQDILDAMPDITSLMTDAKGEAIRALLQSIYDDCCPNTLLTSIKNNTYDSKNHLGNIAADSSYQTIRLAEIRDRVALETTLQSILGALPSTSGLALDATLQALLTCCNQRGTEATLQAIQGDIPSTSGLALDATLEQVRINTSHLDQIESSLDIIRAELLAIKDCVCSGSGGGSKCCDPNQNFDEWEEDAPEWEGADPGTDPPPSGFASWSEWDNVVCGRINAYVEKIIEDLSWWENFLSQFGIHTASSVPATSLVRGVARTFLAKQGEGVLLSKGLTQTSMVPGWAWVAWLAALVASAAGLLSGIIKTQVVDLRCSLVNNIYGSRYGGSDYAKTRLDAWLHDNFYVIGSATPAFLAVYFLKTDFDILYSHLAWTDDPFAMNPCICYDNEEMFDPYIWLITNPSTSITVDGSNYVTQWNDSGSWGGHFASTVSANRPVWESGAVRFYASDCMRSYPAGHPKIYAVFVLWDHVSSGYILGRFNSGTDSWHYRPSLAWGGANHNVSYISSNGSTTGNCRPTLPDGYNLWTVYYNSTTDRTYVRLNGLEICSIGGGSGSTFVNSTAFIFVGGHPDYPSAGAQWFAKEIAMYDRELTIDEVEAIEPAILANNPTV
jgi:hypothetical protein